VKFSVITICPISTSISVADSPFDWESATVVVEYLFVGTIANIRQNDLESQEKLRLRINNQNHLYEGISWFSPESKNLVQNLIKRSGKYKDAVPTSG
jgi:hypothetical protein